MEVGGDSLMARLLRKTVSVFNSSAHFDIDGSNRRCSVVPSSLPPSLYLNCCVCVLMVALFSLVQVYSSRLRRVICASFYPQREKMRVRFLYNVLLQSNRKCPTSDRKCSSDRLVCNCCQTGDVQYQPT
uniref:Dendritic cell-specific transmembrane protein-like domain-containing protein n=1 Tax=Knipowitschia caucasica TaxID=637954 RepID=A0AAV2ME74_KNICA